MNYTSSNDLHNRDPQDKHNDCWCFIHRISTFNGSSPHSGHLKKGIHLCNFKATYECKHAKSGSNKQSTNVEINLHLKKAFEFTQEGGDVHVDKIPRSRAPTMWSQFLQKIANSVTAKKVQKMWKRLFIIGAVNFAMVDTQTRTTVIKATSMFIHLPKSTLAFTVSDCTANCSCWWSSSLETRVWQDSKASY